MLSGLMLAMTFTANIGTFQSALGASTGQRVTDFNNDGYEDLAIGVPSESINTSTAFDAGAVNVIHGTSTGLSAIPDGAGTGLADQFWSQNSPHVQGVACCGDQFGNALTSGDFNQDGYSDLAVGTLRGGGIQVGGEVNVIYGSTSFGLSASATLPDQLFNLLSPGIEGNADLDDLFGSALASGDFNNDGYDDLAIGNPERNITTPSGTQENAGAAYVLYGSSEGLSAFAASDGTGREDQIWSQNTFGVQDISEQADLFGSALGSGDFNNDGYDDLAIGAPGETINIASSAGALNIIYGSPIGLSQTYISNQFLFQGSAGLDEQPSQDDRFGSVLTSGDFDDDGYDDLAVGIPYESVLSCLPLDPSTCFSNSQAGAVEVIYGSTSGLSAIAREDQFWHQDRVGGEILGIIDSAEQFGFSVVTGDFNGDGYDDLGVGVPQDDGSIPGKAGAVNVIYGSPTGLSGNFVPNQYFTQNSPNVNEAEADSDRFGNSLAAGNYNGDGSDDLAIGIPGEDVNHDSIADAGAVQVIYGSSEGLSPSGVGTGPEGQIWTQNSADVNDTSELGDLFGWSLT